VKDDSIDLTEWLTDVLGGTCQFGRFIPLIVDRAGKGSLCWTLGTQHHAAFLLHRNAKYSRVGGSLRAGSPA
jgi:hypothetical protein